MNLLRYRIALASLFWSTAKVFDVSISHRPSGEYWDMVYFGGAANVDWIMYYVCQRFVSGKLQRDMEALCIASIATNALGFALYEAEYPPDLYNWMIRVINYVLALRLLILGGGDVLSYHYWHDLVRSIASGHFHNAKEETK